MVVPLSLMISRLVRPSDQCAGSLRAVLLEGGGGSTDSQCDEREQEYVGPHDACESVCRWMTVAARGWMGG